MFVRRWKCCTRTKAADRLGSDTPVVYAVTILMIVVCALLGDYLERSETSMALIQQLRRAFLSLIKRIPRA